uniref:Uncharacterized protein n=1 Tax=Rhizophora mucronata TaxID=61149 RepID=A0A2P2MT37_RHIMU
MRSTESCSISTLAASTRQEGRLEMILFSTDSRNSLDTSTWVPASTCVGPNKGLITCLP